MKNFLFIFLLFPLLVFGQAEKTHRSIIIDSIKAFNGGIIDVKDTLKQDIGIKFNDGTFQSTAAVGGADGNGIYDGSGVIPLSTTSVLSDTWTIKGTSTATETFLDFTRSDDIKSVSVGINSGIGFIQVRNPTGGIDTRIGAGFSVNSFFKRGLYIGENALVSSRFQITTTNTEEFVHIKNSNNLKGVESRVNTTRTIYRLYDGQGDVVGTNTFVTFRSDNFDNWIQPGNDALAIGHQSGTAMLDIRGKDATSANFALKVQSNVGTHLLSVKNDGQVVTEITLNYFTDTSIANDNYGIEEALFDIYTTGMNLYVSIGVANTGAATLQINALAAKTIKKLHDQDLITGDIEAGQIIHIIFDGTNWQMLSQLGQ